MATKKISSKKITKTIKKKTKQQTGKIGEYTGISLPLPDFPKGYEDLQEFCETIARRTNSENGDLIQHQKDSYFSVDDVWGHLRNTNNQIDRLLYIIIQLLHMNYHLLSGFEDIDKIKTNLQQVDEDFKKHKPKLEYIDQQVQAHTQSEERAKRVYG